MHPLQHLIDRNHAWADEAAARDPEFFKRLSGQQAPQYLWIGCADSRVPANQVVNLMPGEVFVHRNVANVVVHTDLNCLSVIQYAIAALKVRHIIVCGHYGCGGVLAALRGDRLGLIDNWLRHVQDIRDNHHDALSELPNVEARHDRLCELNVIEQVAHVCQTTVVQDAWRDGQPLTVYGWIYGLRDGKVRDLGLCADSAAKLESQYRTAVAKSSR